MSKVRIPSARQVEDFLSSQPGARGTQIPAEIFDKIAPVAHGISKQIWGSAAEGAQLQALHDQGLHEPEQIHQAFNSLPHPHASSVTVGEYSKYSAAKGMFDEHQGPQK